MRNQEAQCHNCPHFDYRRTVNGERFGECKANPPVVFMLKKPEENKHNHEDYFPKTIFPQVIETSWCGKHPDFYGQPDDTLQHREM